MQPGHSGSAESGSDAQRYGPLVVIVGLLVGIALMVFIGGGDEDPDATSSGEEHPTSVTSAAVGAPAPTGAMPMTYDEAVAAGTAEDYDWGDRCDPETGRVKVPSVYATPCVPVFEGDNGGATHPGVTDDTITIVRYLPDRGGDIAALLNSIDANDTQPQQTETVEDYLELYSSRAETYGRRFEVIEVSASGGLEDEVAARADAVQIATEIKPFAVIGGPALDGGAFAEELARNEILCVGCGVALPESVIQENAPYVWGAQPSPDQSLSTLAPWINRTDEAAVAAGNPDGATNAVFSPQFEDTERKVGVIHYDRDPPIFGDTAEAQEAMFEETAHESESYLFDLATMPEKATELIAKYKSAGITTILFLGDPMMPVQLTKAATEQEYFPEWILAGAVLTDTNMFGRLYDQEQMTQAFGISNLAVPTIQDLQDPIVVYRWYFGADTLPPAPSQYALLQPPARLLVDGVNMAGPELTPDTFAQGLFRMPPSGGGPTTPQISYGNWGFYAQSDYMGIDDSVEIWWDGSVEAADERGAPGVGVWRRAHDGERFTAEDAPAPAPFDDQDSVTVFDELPPEDTPPTYEPPPGSPAAG